MKTMFDRTEDDQDEFDDDHDDRMHFLFSSIAVLILIVSLSFAVGYVFGINVADDCIHTIHKR